MSDSSKSRIVQPLHSSSAHCKVCGDRASGKHYGVPSCDGCRGFFKRSIRRNLEYTCKEGGKCIVDVSRRNQCQACRFSKCLAANMRPEAVQHERAPRSCVNSNHLASALSASASHLDTYTTRRLPLHSNGLILPIPMHLPASFSTAATPMEAPRYYPHFTSFHSNLFDSLHFGTGMFSKPSSASSSSLTTTGTTVSAGHSTANILPATPSKSYYHSAAATSSMGGGGGVGNRIATHTRLDVTAKEDEVSSTEETRALSSFSAVNLSNSMSEQEAIFESAAKLLFLAVKWAKSIPSFNQITAHDQNLLLEDCWAELFVIMAAQYGLPIGNLLMSAADLTSRKLLKAIHQILLLRLSHTEFVCLKTLILFRPDCIGLASSYEVTMLQDEALNLLLESCGGTRMGHILLTLPYIRSAADRQLIQELLFKKTIGEVAIENVLSELMRT